MKPPPQPTPLIRRTALRVALDQLERNIHYGGEALFRRAPPTVRAGRSDDIMRAVTDVRVAGGSASLDLVLVGTCLATRLTRLTRTPKE